MAGLSVDRQPSSPAPISVPGVVDGRTVEPVDTAAAGGNGKDPEGSKEVSEKPKRRRNRKKKGKPQLPPLVALDVNDPSVAQFLKETFSGLLVEKAADLAPRSSERNAFNNIIMAVRTLVAITFGPGATLHCFGSAASELNLRTSSDIDLCIEITPELLSQISAQASEEQVTNLCDSIRRKNKEFRSEFIRRREKKVDLKKEDGSGEDSESEDDAAEEEEEEEIPPHVIERALALNMLAKRMKKDFAWKQVFEIRGAKVPIVKAVHAKHNIAVDIGCGNIMGTHNTALLKAYKALDPRFQRLVYLIKYWSKRKDVSDPSKGTISSYAHVLMLVHYLQVGCNPPVFPSLIELAKHNTDRQFCQAGNLMHDVTYVKSIADFISPNTQSLGELFYGFMLYWATFDFEARVISIRGLPEPTREEKFWSSRMKGPENAGVYKRGCIQICIEDPFELPHNLGRPMNGRHLKRMVSYYRTAVECIEAAYKDGKLEYIDEGVFAIESGQKRGPYRPAYRSREKVEPANQVQPADSGENGSTSRPRGGGNGRGRGRRDQRSRRGRRSSNSTLRNGNNNNDTSDNIMSRLGPVNGVAE